MASPTTKRSISASLIIGTLLVPMSALAAIWLTDPGTADAPADESVVETTQATTLPLAEVATTSPADMERACGPEGRTLVDLEAEGTITDIQQAALDALRPVCESAGLSLPAAPTPEPVIQTVVAPAATTATTLDDSWDDDHDEDEYEEDEHEDEEHEDHDDDHDREDDD